jgi:hypothetical protein
MSKDHEVDFQVLTWEEAQGNITEIVFVSSKQDLQLSE